MNMTDLKLAQEEQFILACLRTEFSGNGDGDFPAFDYDSFDWDRVYKKSSQWRIAPLLYMVIEKRLKSPLKKGDKGGCYPLTNCPPLAGVGGGQIPKHFLEKLKVEYVITGRKIF